MFLKFESIHKLQNHLAAASVPRVTSCSPVSNWKLFQSFSRMEAVQVAQEKDGFLPLFFGPSFRRFTVFDLDSREAREVIFGPADFSHSHIDHLWSIQSSEPRNHLQHGQSWPKYESWNAIQPFDCNSSLNYAHAHLDAVYICVYTFIFIYIYIILSFRSSHTCRSVHNKME